MFLPWFIRPLCMLLHLLSRLRVATLRLSSRTSWCFNATFPGAFIILFIRKLQRTDTKTCTNLWKGCPRDIFLETQPCSESDATQAQPQLHHGRFTTLTPQYALRTLPHSRCLRPNLTHTLDDFKSSALMHLCSRARLRPRQDCFRAMPSFSNY